MSQFSLARGFFKGMTKYILHIFWALLQANIVKSEKKVPEEINLPIRGGNLLRTLRTQTIDFTGSAPNAAKKGLRWPKYHLDSQS